MTHHVLLDRARRMRRDMPDCEVRLWGKLRGRQLEGAKFRRQLPIGPFIVDFACVEARLIVEVDGDTHGTEEQEGKDEVRTAWLEHNGWRVIRFWTDEVNGHLDDVVEEIWEAIAGASGDASQASI